MNIFEKNKNSWLQSSKNIEFNNNILEADLENSRGIWIYNKLEINNLLLNKKLENSDGCFKYCLSREEDDEIMNKIFYKYSGPTIDIINIEECNMLSVDHHKYNETRNKTLSILNKYKLPPVNTHYGYMPETEQNSKFYRYMLNKSQRNYFTVGMLEIFEKFVNKYKVAKPKAWMLYFEDDVRPINVDEECDLTKLYNIPKDAELIRPYMGKNEKCDLGKAQYKISYGGGNNHAFYISVSGCIKILNYVRKYKWRFVCDIDLYKLGKECSGFPTGYDGWSFSATNYENEISNIVNEDEKISMYSIDKIIFNQTSNPCV